MYRPEQALRGLPLSLIQVTRINPFKLSCIYIVTAPPQSCQSEEVSTSVCRQLCQARGINFIRFNPLLSENIPIPEEASIETLVNVMITTITHVATGDGKEIVKDMLRVL